MLRNLLPVLLLVISVSVCGQQKGQAPSKLSPDLQQLIESKTGIDSLDVSVAFKKTAPPKGAFRILSSPAQGFVLVVRLPARHLAAFSQSEDVVFIQRMRQPKEEVNTGTSDPTLNLLTYAQNRFPRVRGNAIHSSVKERLLDTTDIDLKGRIFTTGLENASVTTHASLMATIMAGAANTSPFAKGAAPAAAVTSSSFDNLFPDPDSIFRKYSISVQNHSYGTAVENFYGNEAAAYDLNAVSNPQLLHVFSAGNSGSVTNTTGPYAGVTNMANLSGDFKQAKNLVTVSAVDSAGQLLLLSSKGPAYDGRVKPELVAYGEDGSSGAAALTSGTAILVQDLYSRLHAGALPSSALVKAFLLNSADDAGEKNVDYKAGYGLLNAYQALQTVDESRFWEGAVAQNETKTFTIDIPANASQVKLTLAWTDPPATPNAAKALVNDLDLVLRSASNETWLPWVLSADQVLDSVLSPAQRKVDTLNNVEQISVDNPAAGTYTIDVKGSRLFSASQAFALAYQVDTTNTFYWTYPTATDHLVAGARQALRWHTNLTGSGIVEYATTANNWRTVGTVDTLTKNFLKWEVPDTVTNARFRMVTTSTSFVSDTFTINPRQNLKTGFTCVDSFLLYWKSLPVDQYRLYNLGEKYLEPVLLLPDTAVVLQKTQHPSLFYSVAPLIDGREGIRSNAINYLFQGVGCYLRSFYLQAQTATTASLVAELGSAYNVTEVSLEKFNGTGFVTLQTIAAPQTISFTFNDPALNQGENLYRFKITLAGGSLIYSNIETVYSVGGTATVLFYPNPVRQNSELKLIVKEVGRYTIQFIDATGKQVYQTELNSSIMTVPASRFSKGVYFIRIIDKDGKAQLHKQIIF